MEMDRQMDKERELTIEALQKRLDERGIRDIKVFWSENFSKFSNSYLEKELIIILNSYLDGDFVPLKPIGDKLLSHAPSIQKPTYPDYTK